MSAVARRQEQLADRAITFAEVGLALLVFLALPTAIIVFSARNHEFWRDEAQAVLIARNAPFPEFFGAMHVEGIPFLFHLVLKALTVFFVPVTALLVAGWIGIETMLFGTYRLLLAISGRRLLSLAATLLFGLTYNYAYELGAVIRPYGLSLGLALLSMALFRDALRTGQRSLVVFGAIATALGACSTAHGACICGGALAAFFCCALVRGQLDWRSFLVLFAPLPFFALTAWLALPFPGRFAWPPENSAETFSAAASLAHQALLGSFTPQDW